MARPDRWHGPNGAQTRCADKQSAGAAHGRHRRRRRIKAAALSSAIGAPGVVAPAPAAHRRVGAAVALKGQGHGQATAHQRGAEAGHGPTQVPRGDHLLAAF